MEEGARELAEKERELPRQRKKMLTDARQYVARCENGEIVV